MTLDETTLKFQLYIEGSSMAGERICNRDSVERWFCRRCCCCCCYRLSFVLSACSCSLGYLYTYALSSFIFFSFFVRIRASNSTWIVVHTDVIFVIFICMQSDITCCLNFRLCFLVKNYSALIHLRGEKTEFCFDFGE